MPRKVPPAHPFGKRLMELRIERKLTQSQLAELIGSSQRCISRYETIAELPPAYVIVELAKALKVSTDDLFGLRLPKNPPKPKEDPELRRLWRRFQQLASLPEKDQRAVIRLISSLVSLRTGSDAADAA